MISIDDFIKVEIRVGTIIEAAVNRKASKPAYKLKIDLGTEIGMKRSSAQITELYTPEDLIGKQVLCCVNLIPMHIGDIKSEVRILGTDSAQGIVLVSPDEKVENGDLLC